MSTLRIYQPDTLRIRMTSQIVMKISLHRRSIKIVRLLDLVLDTPTRWIMFVFGNLVVADQK